MNGWSLVSDVGGTNARFARALPDATLRDARTYRVSRFPTFLEAIDAYLAETGGRGGCTSVAIGAAGPVENGHVQLTNTQWTISEADVASAVGAPCLIVNDLEAVAYCLPDLSESDFRVIGEPRPNLSQASRILAANVGTGFGAATLLRTPSGWISCPSEAGHMSISLHDPKLKDHLFSAEHVLSGPGLEKLYALLSESGGLTAPELFKLSEDRRDCSEVIRIFTEVLGTILGNLVLGVAAWDGVFLFGSVAAGFAGVADGQRLRAAFESKGAMTSRMKRVPIAWVTKEAAALWGLAALTRRARGI